MLVEAGGDANDILGMMLSIGVGGDDAGQAGKNAEGVVDAGLERRAFAEIDGVAEDLDAGDAGCLVEDFAELGAAAVVDQQDGGHAAGGEVTDEIDESGGGPVGGDQDDGLDGLVRLHGVRAPLGCTRRSLMPHLHKAEPYATDFCCAASRRAWARAMARRAEPGSTPRAGFNPSSWARCKAAWARCTSISSARSAQSANTRTWSSSTSRNPWWTERYRFLPSATYVIMPMPSKPSSGAWPGGSA